MGASLCRLQRRFQHPSEELIQSLSPPKNRHLLWVSYITCAPVREAKTELHYNCFGREFLERLITFPFSATLPTCHQR
jgi:hypothetical protein